MKKVVLITGASSGMGKETAILLNEQGYTVYAVARRVDKMRELETRWAANWWVHLVPGITSVNLESRH